MDQGRVNDLILADGYFRRGDRSGEGLGICTTSFLASDPTSTRRVTITEGIGALMERVRLWRNGRQRLIGTVELDEEHRRLGFHIDDHDEQHYVSGIFSTTGEVSWAWTRHGETKREERRAEPLTADWFWFVVHHRLHPLGYQVDFGASEY